MSRHWIAVVVGLLIAVTAASGCANGAPGAGETAPDGPDAGPAPVCEQSCVFPVADHVDLGHKVWGEPDVHFYVPSPAWAMAATQSSRILAYYMGGHIDRTVSPNWFLATALKESFLGCCTEVAADSVHDAQWAHRSASVHDGCFQIEPTTAFTELQRIFPGHYTGATHAEYVAGCRVETSAVTMAFYDAFALGMMYGVNGDASSFFSAVRDPYGVEIAFSIAYNRGTWSNEFRIAITECAGASDMLACVFGGVETVAWDHADAIQHYIRDLDGAAARGQCYDAAMTSADVADYVTAVAPLIAPGREASLRDRAVAAFEADAGGTSGRFQANFGAVLRVMEAEPLQDPAAQLSEWYGVELPDHATSYAWPDVADSCGSVGPIL